MPKGERGISEHLSYNVIFSSYYIGHFATKRSVQLMGLHLPIVVNVYVVFRQFILYIYSCSWRCVLCSEKIPSGVRGALLTTGWWYLKNTQLLGGFGCWFSGEDHVGLWVFDI